MTLIPALDLAISIMLATVLTTYNPNVMLQKKMHDRTSLANCDFLAVEHDLDLYLNLNIIVSTSSLTFVMIIVYDRIFAFE